MLEKGIFINDYESPEGTAERLSEMVKKHYEPAIKEASVSRLERSKRKQAEETSKRKDMELKKAQERLQGFDNAFKGLSTAQMQKLAEQAATKRRANEIELEQLKRINALPELHNRGTGAAKTFARHALEALRTVDMNHKKVDWDAVEKSAKKESRFENHQPVYEIAKALLTYSPGQADKNDAYRKTILEQAKEMDKKEMPSREVGKTKGFSPER
jgi:hypothetical protein